MSKAFSIVRAITIKNAAEGLLFDIADGKETDSDNVIKLLGNDTTANILPGTKCYNTAMVDGNGDEIFEGDYLRGANVSGYVKKPWGVAQSCDETLPKENNELLKFEVAKGSTVYNIRLDAALGVNPREEFDALLEIFTEHQAVPLILDGEPIGDGLWIIENIDENFEVVNNKGTAIALEVPLKLREYVEAEEGE